MVTWSKNFPKYNFIEYSLNKSQTESFEMAIFNAKLFHFGVGVISSCNLNFPHDIWPKIDHDL